MSLPSHLITVAGECVSLLDSLEAAIHAAQETFRSLTGQFCQLLCPHDVTPADGVPLECDWTRKACDVGLSWADSDIGGLLPSHLPCTPCCDVWVDANGPGYAITIFLASSVTGEEYFYRRTYGPAGLVDTADWQEVIDYVV